MSETKPHAELAGELRARIADLKELADELRQKLVDAGEGTPHRDLMNSAGKYLHDFYNALEDAASRVSKDIHGETPGGPDSHARLLARVLAEVPGSRRALFSAALAKDLEELRDFRRFFRHSYRAKMDWTELRPNLERALRIAPEVERDLSAFAGWLESGDPP